MRSSPRWADVLLIFGSCLVANVIGAVASWYIASSIVNGIVEREGPGGLDIRFPMAFYGCRLCGGLLGPLVAYLVPTRTPRFLAKSFISLGFGIAWVVLLMDPLSSINQWFAE